MSWSAAGSSGAALAARLGERGGRTTCLIEAGGQDTHPFIHVPSFVAAAIGREATQLAVQDRAASRAWPGARSRCRAARCSADRARSTGWSISAAIRPITTTGPTLGATGWSYAEVLPYFTRTENNENFPESVFHGHGGPINVKVVDGPNALNYAFMDALARAAIPGLPGLQRAELRRLRPPPGPDARRAAREHRQEHAPPGAARAATSMSRPMRQVRAGAGRERPRDRGRTDRRRA